jgi:5'-nucleotidase / UDP-sugar diphosphatase
MSRRPFILVVWLVVLALALLVRGCIPSEPGAPIPPTRTTTPTAVPASPTPLPSATSAATVPPTAVSSTPAPVATQTATAVPPTLTPTATLSPVPTMPVAYHVIRAGDTYWTQAEVWWGNPYCWPTLEEANGWDRFELPVGAPMALPAGCLEVVAR